MEAGREPRTTDVPRGGAPGPEVWGPKADDLAAADLGPVMPSLFSGPQPVGTWKLSAERGGR